MPAEARTKPADLCAAAWTRDKILSHPYLIWFARGAYLHCAKSRQSPTGAAWIADDYAGLCMDFQQDNALISARFGCSTVQPYIGQLTNIEHRHRRSPTAPGTQTAQK